MVDPGNSARATNGAALDARDPRDPVGRPSAGRRVHFLRAEGHDRLARRSEARWEGDSGGTCPARVLQPAEVDTSRGRGRRRAFASRVLRARSTFDVLPRQSTITASLDIARRPEVRTVSGESVGAPPDPS